MRCLILQCILSRNRMGHESPPRKGEIMMACAMKFSAGAVRNPTSPQPANNRTFEQPGTLTRSGWNMTMFCRQTGHDRVRLFLQRKSELYCYNRDDVKVMVGWIVTAPQDLDPARYDNFFCASYDFMANRYGEENVVQAIVHDDEGGQPHLHFCFIPVEGRFEARTGLQNLC